MKLVFQGFVVLVGALILSGAVNTAIVGANGVLSRMVEDGVLTTWFKKPQKKFGTSYRVINMIAGCRFSPSLPAGATCICWRRCMRSA